MTEARKRRELLPLIHHHLVQAGYVRAARELKLQSGQKTFPEQSVTLLDIYTHWQQTSRVAKKRKAEEADGEIPYKVRVSDPTSSSESSEEEKEQERMGKTVKTLRVLHSNSVSVIKDAQCKNSLSPKEKVKTKNKKGTAVTSALHPDPLEAQTASGKPDPTVSVQSHSKKSPAAPRKQATQPASNSLATHSEEKVASPVVKPFPKPATMPLDKKMESSNEDSSSDETDIEMEKPMGNSVPVRGDPVALGPTKGNQVIIPSPIRVVAKVPTAKEESPEETSESSDESESDDDTPPQRQAQEGKTPHLGAVPAWEGKTPPTTGKTVTPSSKPNLGLPSQVAETQKSEESSESSEESESEEEKAELKRPQVKIAPASAVKVSPGKGVIPASGKPVAPQLQVQAATPGSAEASSESSEDSESDGAASAPRGQEMSSVKSPQASATPANRTPASSLTKGPLSKGTLQAKASEPSVSENSSDSSEDSETEENIVVPQTQEKSSGKAPQASATKVKGTLLGAEKPAFSVPQVKMEPSVAQARIGPSAIAWEPGSSESSSESSEESGIEEEIKTPQGKEKSPVKILQNNAITKKVASDPSQGPQGKEALSTLGKSRTRTVEIRVPLAVDSSGSETTESSEESEGEEETSTLQTQAVSSVKTPQLKASPSPTTRRPLGKGVLPTSGKLASAASNGKGTSPTKAMGAGKPKESSSESSDETDSDVEVPVSQGQTKPSVKAPQINTSAQKLDTITSISSKGTQGRVSTPAPCKSGTLPLQAKTAGPGRPEDTSESSEESESEEESPASRGQAKSTMKASQVNTPPGKGAPLTPLASQGTQGRVSTPAPCKSGTLPLQAKAAGPVRPEDTSESSEESESEEESPASQGQAKLAVKTPQADTISGKGTSVSPKGTQGKASTLPPLKSATVPLQAKGEVQHKIGWLGKPEKTSESSEDSECEDTIPVSQVQVKPGVILPTVLEGKKETTASSPKKSAVPSLQAMKVDSSSSEESSSSSDEVVMPATQRQAKPTMKASQVDTPPGKRAPVTPLSTKDTQGRVSTPAPWKSGSVPLQAKAAGPGRPEDTSESSEESESEEEVNPSAQIPQRKAAEKPAAPVTTVEETSSESSQDTESEGEVPTPQGQIKTALKSIQINTTSGRESRSTPASGKPVPSSQATKTEPISPEEPSDSSEESESEDEVISVQIKTIMKTPEVAAVSARKSEPVPVPRKSAIPPPQTQVGPPAQGAGTSGSEESSSSSDESGRKLVSSGKKDEKAGTVKNNVGKVSTALPDKQLAAPDTTRNQKSESNNGEPTTTQVIKNPLIFVGPKHSPADKAAVSTKAGTVPRKRQVSENREQSSSESENDAIPDTQHPTLPTIKVSMVKVAPMCQKATCLPSTGQPEASSEESSRESASEEQGTGTSQTICDKNKTTKQDKKSKLAEGTQATANQDSISVTASNGTKSEKEDPNAIRAKQTQSLGLSPKGKASVKTESPEDSSEDEIIEPSQSILSAYAFPSSSLPISINPQLQKAPPKQRPEAVASAGPAQPACSKESPQDDSSDSETDSEIGSIEKPPQTGKELKISVSRRQMIRKGFKPGAVNCKTTSPKQGNDCQSPMQTMVPSNLPSLIQHQVSNVNENSELNSTFFNSKASGITMLSDLPQIEKKKKSTESLKPGKGSKKSKPKRKLTEESPVAKAPKSKKKKLMGEIHKDGEALQEKTPGTPQVGKTEKASSDAKEMKLKGQHHSKKNKGKPDGNVTVTVGESREMLGTKTKKMKKHKKKSDKKKKDKDKKDKKKKKNKSTSKDSNAASVSSLKKEKKKKKKIKQVD
ncbi:treacle protein isoform X3 [Sarcophilus harrisii]|uniref:treacle protein isoform X3 n=1 Tax=Sarcophilus harrisii TaxID=9305 RepID=UPI001301AAB6|nr:treacle protein isoform X3 [Sarcophilus harrisii]